MFNFIKKLFGKDKYSKFIKSYVPLSEKEMPYYVDPELKGEGKIIIPPIQKIRNEGERVTFEEASEIFSERSKIKEAIYIILNNAGEGLHHKEIYKYPSVNFYDHKRFVSVLYSLATKGHISYAKEKGKGFFKINEEQFKFSK
jgi:hypothetical protein